MPTHGLAASCALIVGRSDDRDVPELCQEPTELMRDHTEYSTLRCSFFGRCVRFRCWCLQPFWVLDHRNEEFDGSRSRDRCQPWSGNSAHLVQRSVRQALFNLLRSCLRNKGTTYVRRSHDVVAVIASQPLMSSRGNLSPRTVPHHQVRIEPERRVEHDLK